MNSLDDRYGSTYRIRPISDELKKYSHQVEYYEKKMSFSIKFFDMIWTSFHSSYDVLILQKFNPLTLLPLIVGKIRGKYVIVDWDDWDTGLQKNTILKWMTWICEKIGPIFPNLITSHSVGLLKLVPKNTNTVLLEQGYDDQLFQKNENRHEIKSRLGIAPHQTVIGYMCTFTYGGSLDLNDILHEIALVQRADFTYVIVGGGELLEYYKTKSHQLGNRRIIFTGAIEHELISSYLSIFDLGLVLMKDVPANRYRVSFKVLEYLASGIPIVGTLVGETNRLFGSYIDQLSADKLSNYLSTLDIRQLPKTKSTQGLLNSFVWSKIIGTLHQRLLTLEDH